MTLNIKDAEAERLARELARRTGTTMTGAVVTALRERLAREERKTEDVNTLVADREHFYNRTRTPFACSFFPTVQARLCT